MYDLSMQLVDLDLRHNKNDHFSKVSAFANLISISVHGNYLSVKFNVTFNCTLG